MTVKTVDVLLVGAGAMSSTLAMILKQLDPSLKVCVVERLKSVAKESTDGWNNAGTGHAAYCELNYTPESEQGDVDISKALSINASFELIQSSLRIGENIGISNKLRFISIENEPEFIPVYIAGPSNAWGITLIDLIDSIIIKPDVIVNISNSRSLLDDFDT